MMLQRANYILKCQLKQNTGLDKTFCKIYLYIYILERSWFYYTEGHELKDAHTLLLPNAIHQHVHAFVYKVPVGLT